MTWFNRMKIVDEAHRQLIASAESIIAPSVVGSRCRYQTVMNLSVSMQVCEELGKRLANSYSPNTPPLHDAFREWHQSMRDEERERNLFLSQIVKDTELACEDIKRDAQSLGNNMMNAHKKVDEFQMHTNRVDQTRNWIGTAGPGMLHRLMNLFSASHETLVDQIGKMNNSITDIRHRMHALIEEAESGG